MRDLFGSLFLLILPILSYGTSSTAVNTIAIFGGSGKLGSECVYQALQRGNQVVVLARNKSNVVIPQGSGGENSGQPIKSSNLLVIEGTVTDQESVDKVFDGTRVTSVIVVLGGRTSNVGSTMLTNGTRHIINSMKRNNVQRVAIVTSIGCGDSEYKAPWSFRILLNTVMRKTKKDKNNQEKLFTSSDGPGHDLEYTILRPGGLGLGAPTGILYANLEKNGAGGEGGPVHRSDLAAFLLEAVNIHSEKPFPYLRKTPGISSILGTGWKKEKGRGFDVVTKG